MTQQPKKRKLWAPWKEWEWNPVPWLSVCAPTVHVKVREAGMAERWRWRRERGRLFTCEMRRLTEMPMANNTSSGSWEKMRQWMTSSCRSEYNQAECSKCRVMHDGVQFKDAGIHHMSGRKSGVNDGLSAEESLKATNQKRGQQTKTTGCASHYVLLFTSASV